MRIEHPRAPESPIEVTPGAYRTMWHGLGWRPSVRCRCGAAREVIEAVELGGRSSWIPGPLIEPCTCPPTPRCVTCRHVLDKEQRCQTLFCPLEGATMFIPEFEPPELKHSGTFSNVIPRPDWFKKLP